MRLVESGGGGVSGSRRGRPARSWCFYGAGQRHRVRGGQGVVVVPTSALAPDADGFVVPNRIEGLGVDRGAWIVGVQQHPAPEHYEAVAAGALKCAGSPDCERGTSTLPWHAKWSRAELPRVCLTLHRVEAAPEPAIYAHQAQQLSPIVRTQRTLSVVSDIRNAKRAWVFTPPRCW